MHFLVDQGFGACLADDMGLGKTIQAITVMLDWRKQRNSQTAILIVCPVSVLGNWRRELLKFSPSLRVALHHGNSDDCIAHNAYAGSMTDFGGPSGSGYSYCRSSGSACSCKGGSACTEHGSCRPDVPYHIYLCK